MTSKGLRLLAYGRVSDVRGRSGESFISPEDQMAKCRAYAEAYEHEILEEGLDLDVSGGVMERPVLDRFLAQIRDGEAQGLIVAKLDRFSRSSRGALNALAEIEAAGGVLISVQEQIDSTTAAGRFVRSIFLATAEWERGRIGENWTAAQKSAVGRGVHISRHVPPGYMRDEIPASDGRHKISPLRPDPKHGKTITEAYRLAAQGAAPARIAEYLTERGLASGDNGHAVWKSSRIKRLLANRVYLGEARYGEIVNVGAHEPLTDQATWLLAQRDKREPAVSPESAYLLTGLVRCASCRHAMRPAAARGKAIATYRCATETASGRCPHPSSTSMQRLDDFVLEQFTFRALSSPSEAREERDDTELLAHIEDARKAVGEVEALRGELRPAAYAQALDSALGELEDAEQTFAREGHFDDHDVALLANAALPLLDPSKRLDSEGTKTVRAALAREIAAVFVRPAASRSNKLPIEDRVKIVWAGEEELELPRRGERFEPRAYTW